VTTFYLDENVSHRIVPFLEAAGHQIVTARSAGMIGAEDEDQLFFAWQRGLIIAAHNLIHFLLIHRTLHRWNSIWAHDSIHAGILAIRNSLPIREQASVLDIFIASNLPTANAFHEWRDVGSWVRR
jgi:Domain of unknown function (DUF5615)